MNKQRVNLRKSSAQCGCYLKVALMQFVCAGFAAAQTSGLDTEARRADAVIVTGNALNKDDPLAPTTVLSGEKLLLKKEGSIAATLESQPGVSATHFGPNANRPVIRGLDADRIRVLNNSGASADASSLSNDHAVPLDPLVVQRIEVLRGPSALLYGGNAVGGVVNIIDNRIPSDAINSPSGAIEWRGNSANRGSSVGLIFETGNEGLNLHADAFTRRAGNTCIPSTQLTPERRAEAIAALGQGRDAFIGGEGQIYNSQASASGGAIGGSYVGERGYAGVAMSSYQTDYGTVAEPNVTIRMQQDQWRVESQLQKLQAQTRGWVSTVTLKANTSDYHHTEYEDNSPATTFKSQGKDWRIDLQQETQRFNDWQLKGAAGVQYESQGFSALGEEAFVPGTRTLVNSFYVYEEMSLRNEWELGFGLRSERNKVSSMGAPTGNVTDKFGAPSEKRFSLHSTALHVQYALNTHWRASLQLTRNHRAPKFYELFSDGVHAATGNYEQGDTTLQKEQSRSSEIILRYKQLQSQAQLAVYETRFDNYIGLFATGERYQTVDLDVPVFRFSAVPALFRGYEFEAKHQFKAAQLSWELSGKLDKVRAIDMRSGSVLPRVAPLRASLGLDAIHSMFSAGLAVQWYARPEVPAGEYRTEAYTLLNAYSSYRYVFSEALTALFFVRLSNLTNAVARPATSFLREMSPLPGRAIELGVQFRF